MTMCWRRVGGPSTPVLAAACLQSAGWPNCHTQGVDERQSHSARRALDHESATQFYHRCRGHRLAVAPARCHRAVVAWLAVPTAECVAYVTPVEPIHSAQCPPILYGVDRPSPAGTAEFGESKPRELLSGSGSGSAVQVCFTSVCGQVQPLDVGCRARQQGPLKASAVEVTTAVLLGTARCAQCH
jgi:hypothetical protein